MIQIIKTPPKKIGVYTACAVEFWERFGYYTLVPLLTLFMTKFLHYSDDQTYAIYASFVTLIYITPVIGGYLADHYLGFHRSLIFGTLIMFVGYLCISIPTENFLFYGLALIVTGMGFFKAMPYGIIGQVYKKDTTGLDKSCTLYYLSIQIGGVLAVFIAGFIARHFGWHSAFSMAAIGIAIAFLIFVSLRSRFKEKNNAAGLHTVSKPLFLSIGLGTVITVWVIRTLLTNTFFTYIFVIIASILAVLYVLIYTVKACSRKEQSRLLAALILISAGAVFTIFYNQLLTSLTLYIDRHVDHHVLGFNIPTSTFFVFEALWIIVLAPFLSLFYRKVTHTEKDHSTIPWKFAIGIAAVSLGFYVINLSTHFANAHFRVSAWWIILSYGLVAIGELLINALGASMILQYVPRKLTGIMMGIWFLGQGAGGSLAGMLAKLATIPKHITSGATSLQIYGHAFLVFAYVMLSISLVYFALAPFITRLANQESAFSA